MKDAGSAVADGAGAVAMAPVKGLSFLWDKTYRPMPEQRQQLLREMVDASPHAWMDPRSQTYLIPIDDLQPQR